MQVRQVIFSLRIVPLELRQTQRFIKRVLVVESLWGMIPNVSLVLRSYDGVFRLVTPDNNDTQDF